MTTIEAIFIGQSQTLTDERGTWHSSIFRAPVAGPLALTEHGLAGDQVTDTANHGSPDQAVCCHFLDHYVYWNQVYELTGNAQLGPGSVGENWTLRDADESTICVGDIYTVGTARVQVSAPRYPCTKQERKLRLPGFHKRTIETMRTGFYLRVLAPGSVQPGDALTLLERPQPSISLHLVNRSVHQPFDPQLAERLLGVPELAAGWKRILRLMQERHA